MQVLHKIYYAVREKFYRWMLRKLEGKPPFTDESSSYSSNHLNRQNLGV